MELTAYVMDGWTPLIRPASPRRAWMDATRDHYANRCLPLTIANAHGWEILTPAGFEAYWLGGTRPEDIMIRPDADMEPHVVPVGIFGYATLTFHIEAIFRTEPGWNLFVCGPLNGGKDGIYPLSGVIETDWVPYTFTMNWRFTRRNHSIRFEANEPICHFFPVQRGVLEGVKPRIVPLTDDPDLDRQFHAWSQSRHDFHERVAKTPPTTQAESWQRHYYRGIDMDGKQGVEDHEVKLRLCPFTAGGSSAKE